jgi:hypothetical protein
MHSRGALLDHPLRQESGIERQVRIPVMSADPVDLAWEHHWKLNLPSRRGRDFDRAFGRSGKTSPGRASR